ncbi:MAG: hypothetical protein IT360_08375 [Gemmatimonadaceae bacterium]|nr:hypothetical protein [Gemmatimonadaceae bacterium]
MSHILLVGYRAAAVIALLSASTLHAQAERAATTGIVFGISLGVSRVTLSELPNVSRTTGTDVSLGWQVGYRMSSKLSLVLNGASSVYRYAGPGRARKRGFESVVPMIEYQVDHGLRLSAGAGLQLDAPVFYSMRVSDPAERRYWRVVGAVVGVSYALPSLLNGASRSAQRYTPEVQGRWNVGRTNTPEGRLAGQSYAFLLGVRRQPLIPRQP